MESILFKNAALLDPARSELLEGHDVLVEDGLVKEVSDRPLSAARARVIDLKGKTLMPGLIDLHVHPRPHYYGWFLASGVTTVRSANTGISGIIDPLGRVVLQSGLFEPWAAAGEVALLPGETPWVRGGRFFAPLCGLAAAVAVAVTVVRTRRRQAE